MFKRFSLVGVLIMFALGASACRGGSEPEALAPVNAGINVLLITVDTLRADHLSAYGYARPTSPNLEALAAQGVLFETAFTYWPKTRGSFAALFTGLYASQHGLTVRDRDLPDFNQTLAETFQAAGYRTAAALDNGNLDAALGFSQGFDRYEQTWQTMPDASELERTEAITSFGERFLAAGGDERPFFLWLHYVNPHTPYDPPEDVLTRFREDGIVPRGPELERVVGYHGGVNQRQVAVNGETHWGDYIDRYDAEIVVADEQVGRILAALDATGASGTTLVVFTSDHGESLGEHDYYFDHGFDLFNPSLQIPLIVSFPGFLPGGERVQGTVTNLDVYPTVLDLAQVSYPQGLVGKSVLPLVRGTSAKIHDHVFYQNDRHEMAISSGRLKLVHYPPDVFELYDMVRDPNEVENRYEASQGRIAPFKAELSSFRTRTIGWQQKTTAKRDEGGEAAVCDDQLSSAARKALEALGYINADEVKPECDSRQP